MATERTQTIASPRTRHEPDPPRPAPDGSRRSALPEDIDPAQFWRWAARSLGKTSHMLETLPLSDAPNAPFFARTVRDEAFAASQLVPSTVVPPLPGRVPPPTRVP